MIDHDGQSSLASFKNLNPAEQCCLRLVTGLAVAMHHQLDLERVEKSFSSERYPSGLPCGSC